MIITGYPGIGKSTLASKNDKIIDLESSNFWRREKNSYLNFKTRPADWYIYYCQIAKHLSEQGYIVFVSCHKEVRDYLNTHHGFEKFCAIFPSKKIKDEWISRLRKRYSENQSEKNFAALSHAEQFFDKDIDQLWYECQYNVEYYNNAAIIQTIDYDLAELVNNL